MSVCHVPPAKVASACQLGWIAGQQLGGLGQRNGAVARDLQCLVARLGDCLAKPGRDVRPDLSQVKQQVETIARVVRNQVDCQVAVTRDVPSLESDMLAIKPDTVVEYVDKVEAKSLQARSERRAYRFSEFGAVVRI